MGTPTADQIADNRRWLLEKLKKNADVPCGTCNVCCFNKAIFLYPELGEDPAGYDTDPAFNQYYGGFLPMLKHRADGGCIYLSDKGCGIHTRRPAACRAFSCIEQVKMFSRADERRLKREGKWKPEHERGKELRATLGEQHEHDKRRA